MIISTLLFFLFYLSVKGTLPDREPTELTLPRSSKAFSLTDISIHNILDTDPASYFPVLDEFDAMGIVGSILYFCLGKEQHCIQEQFKKAADNSKITADILARPINSNGKAKIGGFLSGNGIQYLLQVWKYDENLTIEIKMVLSIFLLKLEGDEKAGKRVYFHTCSVIRQASNNFNMGDVSIFEFLLKIYLIDQNEKLFLEEMKNWTTRNAFCRTYNQILAWNFISHLFPESPNIFPSIDSLSQRVCKFQNRTADCFLHALYGSVINTLLVNHGSLCKFVKVELGRYLRLWELNITEALTITQAIYDDQVSEIILKNIIDKDQSDSYPFVNSGSGYLLSRQSLETLFTHHYAGIEFPNGLSFKNIFTQLHNPAGFEAKKGQLGEAGSLHPIFIFSFKNNAEEFLFGKKLELFNYHFDGEDDTQRVTFSIKNSKLLKFPGLMGIWGKIVGEFLFITDKHKQEAEKIIGQLYNLIQESSPYLYYELYLKRVSLLKIIDHVGFNNLQ
jgi:hypothetical protein